jgi:hypothetical protein
MDEYTAEARPEVHRLFRSPGYLGELLVVDDSGDESLVVIPSAALDPIPEALSTALQAVLRRSVDRRRRTEMGQAGPSVHVTFGDDD